MVKFFWNEKFKELKLKAKLRHRYAISNYGRLLAFSDKLEDGHFLNGSRISGYKIFIYNYRENGKTKASGTLFHKMVALNFLPPKTRYQLYILHLDHDKLNNHISNLKWATKEAWMEHNKTNPSVIAGVQKMKLGLTSHKFKLTEAKVQMLKQKLFDPNRKTRLRILAKQFGVTEMQLWRIQSGENWSRVKVKINGRTMTTKPKTPPVKKS